MENNDKCIKIRELQNFGKTVRKLSQKDQTNCQGHNMMSKLNLIPPSPAPSLPQPIIKVS